MTVNRRRFKFIRADELAGSALRHMPAGIIPPMPPPPPKPVERTDPPAPAPRDAAVVCDRCGAEMFRMHAVWRCPACGYKTDCCGW